MTPLDHASTIEGWTTIDELRWLRDACAGKELVIEFGAWLGRSTVAMCSAQKVISVDTWLGSPGESEHQERIAGGLDCYGKWCLHTAPFSERITPQVGDLRNEAFKTLLLRKYAGKADLVFVDASHDEASVRSDIVLARQLLKPAGILCGHDYGGSWVEVTKVVNEIVDFPAVAAGSIWRAGP